MENANASADGDDATLATLIHPFASGVLSWPDPEPLRSQPVLFLHARAGEPLHVAPCERIVCEQDFKPHVDGLLRSGLALADPGSCDFPLVLLLPPRQRDEARATLARAIRRTREGGIVVAGASNNEGARSHEADLRRLCGSAQSMSKHHGRVFWSQVHEAALDRALLDAWTELDAPRPIADGRFLSRPGVFAWDRIDAASALLAAHLPSGLSGCGVDLGAGYGYLSAEILARCAGVAALDLYEADARALELARTNAARANARRAVPAKLDFLWHDVTTGLRGGYDFIVSNPPFHIDRADRPGLGRAFIAAAADALRPHGRLWLVANQHLPYEAVLGERYASVRSVANECGFKVIEATKASG